MKISQELKFWNNTSKLVSDIGEMMDVLLSAVNDMVSGCLVFFERKFWFTFQSQLQDIVMIVAIMLGQLLLDGGT